MASEVKNKGLGKQSQAQNVQFPNVSGFVQIGRGEYPAKCPFYNCWVQGYISKLDQTCLA